MLDQKDLTLIEQSVEKVVDRSLEKFAHETLNKSFQETQDQISEVREKIESLDLTLRNQYPNKEYLDNKPADLGSDLGKKIMRREEKGRNFKLHLIGLFEKARVCFGKRACATAGAGIIRCFRNSEKEKGFPHCVLYKPRLEVFFYSVIFNNDIFPS